MKFIRNAVAIGALAGATVVACSSQHGATPGTASNTHQVGNAPAGDNTGSVGMNLITPNGAQIFSVSWSITGTTPYPSYPGGSVNLGDAGIAGNVEFVVGGIESTTSGTPYTLTVTGADTNGDPCSGTSAPFGVAAGADNYVGINITCVIPTDAAVATDANTGSVQIDAGISYVTQGAIQCPGIQSVSVYPALGLVQSGAAASEDLLSVTGVSTNQAPGGTLGTFAWTTNALPGSLPATSTSGTSIQFNCNVAGPGTWTIGVQLQDNTIPVGADASANVCAGQTDTTLTGITVNCAGSGCFLAPGQINCSATADAGGCTPTANNTTSNCGTCGNTCPPAANPTFTQCTSSSSAPGGFACSAPPAVPCTGGVAGAYTPAGCVPCLGNRNGGVCTPTEALVVNFDILTNHVTASTPTTKAASCYLCMVAGECLDTTAGTIGTAPNTVTAHNITGAECGDTGIDGTTGVTNDSSASVTQCSDALQCVLTGGGTYSDPSTGAVLTGGTGECTTGTPGAASSDPSATVGNCYCGANQGSACTSSGPIGPCHTNEATDVSAYVGGATDYTDTLADFTAPNLSPGGVGNQVLNCALTANCNICFTGTATPGTP